MHRSAGIDSDPILEPSCTVEWPSDSKSPEEWVKSQPLDEIKKFYEENGYIVIKDLLNEKELKIYQELYDKMLHGEIDTSRHRHDLGNHLPNKHEKMENITQIMWPSLYVGGLRSGLIHERCLLVARHIFGPDMVADFDMMLAKPPHTEAITPWHCDESYWLDMPDKRALSCWVAMDTTCLDNGCLWFVPGSHKLPMRPHRPAAPGVHVLTCDGSETEGKPQPLSAGWATGHGGRTMHYSRGNSTEGYRRGFVVNFRPEAMVRYEREHNFDHGRAGLTDMLGHQGKEVIEARDEPDIA